MWRKDEPQAPSLPAQMEAASTSAKGAEAKPENKAQVPTSDEVSPVHA